MELIRKEHGITYKSPRVRFSNEEFTFWNTRLKGVGSYPVGPGFPQSTTWDMIRQYGVHVIGGEQDNAGAVQPGTVSSFTFYQSLLSDTQFVALEIWAIVGLIKLYYALDLGVTGNRSLQYYHLLSYTQPSAIAGNTTTTAIQTGDLKSRNLLSSHDTPLNYAVLWITGALNSALNGNAPEHLIKAFWQEPLRIVGPSLSLMTALVTGINAAPSSDTWQTRTVYSLIGRYVEIGMDEYARLAALATGQAIVTTPLVIP